MGVKVVVLLGDGSICCWNIATATAAIGRARLYFSASLVLVTLLCVALIAGRQALNALGLAIGIGLVLVMVATVRAQLGRLDFTLRLRQDKLEVVAPLSNRTIAWSEIAEVRRIAARIFGPPVWACAVLIRGPRSTQPVFLFDSGLEQAEQAFNHIVARSGARVSGQ